MVQHSDTNLVTMNTALWRLVGVGDHIFMPLQKDLRRL